MAGLEGFAEWTQTKVLKVNDTGNYLSQRGSPGSARSLGSVR